MSSELVANLRGHVVADTARIRFADAQHTQIATRGQLGNRVAEWMRGFGAEARAENREVTRTFIQSVRQRFGDEVGDRIEARLQNRLNAASH
jgi:hypothetical protein